MSREEKREARDKYISRHLRGVRKITDDGRIRIIGHRCFSYCSTWFHVRETCFRQAASFMRRDANLVSSRENRSEMYSRIIRVIVSRRNSNEPLPSIRSVARRDFSATLRAKVDGEAVVDKANGTSPTLSRTFESDEVVNAVALVTV